MNETFIRIANMTDSELLKMLDSKREDYTEVAWEFATHELEKRGGRDVILNKVNQGKSLEANESNVTEFSSSVENNVLPSKKNSRSKHIIRALIYVPLLLFAILILHDSLSQVAYRNSLIFTIFHKRNVIELVRRSEMYSGITVESVTTERAGTGARRGIQYKWTAELTENEDGFAIVSFVDKNSFRGWHWEVDIKNKIVRFINDNILLNMKYGFTRIDRTKRFVVNEVKQDTLKHIEYWADRKATWADQIYDTRRIIKNKIVYYYDGSIINNSNKVITDAKISCKLYLIFNVDKILELEQHRGSGFVSAVSTSSPWRPKEVRSFKIEMEPLDDIYKEYKPSKVLFQFDLTATDPVGFEFDGTIVQKELSWFRKQETIITSVIENSQAQKIGLQVGDIIVSYDNIKIETGSQLTEAVRNRIKKDTLLKDKLSRDSINVALINKDGLDIPLIIKRNQKTFTIMAKPGWLGINTQTK